MEPDRSRGPDAGVLTETHISWVLLTGDHAFKIHRPIRTDFLDHRDIEERRQACVDEVALNARLAPDVYRGVGAITLDGTDIEPVVVMRRMPAGRRLSALLDTDHARRHVRDVARHVAAFHASVGPADAELAADLASAAGLRRRWEQDLAGLRAVPGGLGDDPVVDDVEELATEYLAGRSPLLESRIGNGLVRDGHGDLLADDIFCLDDGPRILDCLAFDERLRTVDVLADVAFLVMDLERLGHRDLAIGFLHDYCEFSDEHHPGSLAHLHVAQRALVRAKVSAIRHEQDPDAATATRSFLEQALDHLRRAEVHLAVVGGIPGAGKSTVADRLSDDFGWTVLRSDDVRRDLQLRRADVGDDAYRSDNVDRVYDHLLEEAATLLANGSSVVLDASWTSARRRDVARRTGARHHARVVELRCVAPREVCRRRIEERDPERTTSEATAAVVDLLADAADPWPEARDVDTSGGGDPSHGVVSRAAWLRAARP